MREFPRLRNRHNRSAWRKRYASRNPNKRAGWRHWPGRTDEAARRGAFSGLEEGPRSRRLVRFHAPPLSRRSPSSPRRASRCQVLFGFRSTSSGRGANLFRVTSLLGATDRCDVGGPAAGALARFRISARASARRGDAFSRPSSRRVGLGTLSAREKPSHSANCRSDASVWRRQSQAATARTTARKPGRD